MFVGLFMVPVALACLVQFLFYGYSVMWAGVAVGLAGATLALHNENAYQDSLTGLLNRTYLDYYLARAAQKKNPVICGIMIDADDFKSINDNFGHSEGDEALKNIARILKASLGKEEIAFRYAGDEFIVLNDTGSAELLEDYCRGLKQNLEDYNEKSGKSYHLSLSWGMAKADLGKQSVDDFLKQMDLQMYQKKHKRKEKAIDNTHRGII